jgi:hypothetical protein
VGVAAIALIAFFLYRRRSKQNANNMAGAVEADSKTIIPELQQFYDPPIAELGSYRDIQPPSELEANSMK